MADGEKIGLQAVFEDADFQKGIADYNSAVSDSSSATDKAATGMGGAWEGLSSVGGAAWAGIGIAIAAAVTEMYIAIDAAMETQDIMAAMEFQIGKTGDITGITSEQVIGLADSLSKVLPIDDEVITQAITMGMRFDNVTKDNIEPLIKAAADLSASTGKALPDSMKTLALAIADPEKAMRLFRDANVTLTDAEEKQLKSWKESGDVLATQEFILDKVNAKVGGLAATMGQTASGKAKIMQTAFGNLHETLGGPLLDSLTGVFDKLTNFANDPRTLDFLSELGTKIGSVASSIVDSLPDMFSVIDGVVTWLQDNQPIVIAVLAAIGVAMVALGVTSATALAPVVTAALPVIAIMAAVGAAAALLSTAWQEDWGGIQTEVKKAWDKILPIIERLQVWLGKNLPIALQILSDFWTGVLLPAIKAVVTWWIDNIFPLYVNTAMWLSEKLPVALKFLADFWVNVLLPAIQAVASWISQNVLPLFSALQGWLGVVIPAAIQILSNYWSNVLLPAINAVWGFIKTNLIPLFNALGELLSAVVGAAVRVLANLWTNTLLPALQTIAGYISSTLNPILRAIGDVVSTYVLPLIAPLATFLKNVLLKAFEGIATIIQTIIDNIKILTDALSKLALPPALTPGSPTPFEIGLRGINKELEKMAMATLPAVQYQMEVSGVARDVNSAPAGVGSNSGSISNSNQNTNNYLYGTQFNIPGPSGFVEAMQGL